MNHKVSVCYLLKIFHDNLSITCVLLCLLFITQRMIRGELQSSAILYHARILFKKMQQLELYGFVPANSNAILI
jgi:hypothetical protein